MILLKLIEAIANIIISKIAMAAISGSRLPMSVPSYVDKRNNVCRSEFASSPDSVRIDSGL
jgi:hypothetical protein